MFGFDPGSGWYSTLREGGHVLQDKMGLPSRNMQPKGLSDVGHIEDDGTPKQSFHRMLPSAGWVSLIVALSQGRPVVPLSVVDNHLAAMGPLNALDIAQGKPGLVSTRVKLIP